MAKKTATRNLDDKYHLSADEALSLLSVHVDKRKKRVHTFIDTPIGLFGCDVDLTKLKRTIKGTQQLFLAGSAMTNLGHGVRYYDEKNAYTYAETDKTKLEAMLKERGI